MHYHFATMGKRQMRRLCFVGATLFFLLCVSVAGAESFERGVCKVGGKIVEAIPVDLNGDKLLDLVVSYAKGVEPAAVPRLAIFLATPQGYSASPNIDLAVPADTCLFDVADLDLDGQAELILFRKWKVQAIAIADAQAGEPVTILKRGSGVLFPPYDGELPYEDLVRDWSGDGSVALVLPDYGRLIFFRPNQEEELAQAEVVNAPVRGWIATQGTDPPGQRNYQVHSGTRLPAIFLGPPREESSDLVFTYREELWFHRGQGGRFAKRGKRFYLPILSEDERRRRNMNLLTLVDDLDGDGKPDAILNKFGGSLTNFRSKINIYSGIIGGFSNKPAYELQQSGYTSMLRFWDVDGDGKKEMGMLYADIGLMQIARMLLSKKVKVSFKVFRCRDAVGAQMYAPDADLERQVTYHFDTDSTNAIVGFTPSFDGDFDGDGRPDLFMSYSNGFGAWRNNGQMNFSSEPFITADLVPSITYRLKDLNGDRRCDLFLWDSLNPQRQGTLEVLFNRR